MTETESPFMTLDEAVAFFRGAATRSYVREKCRTGEIPAYKFGRQWRIYRAEFIEKFKYDPSKKNQSCLTKFERARLQVRSLKTEHTETPPHLKGVG